MITVTFEAGNMNVRIVRIVTDSTLAELTTAGWYSQTPPNQLQPSDEVEINYNDGSGGTVTGFFTVSISAGVVTLASSNVAGVTFSGGASVVGDIVVFSDTAGNIKEPTSTITATQAIATTSYIIANGFNSGTAGSIAGYLRMENAGAAAGSLSILSSDNAGDFTIGITNASMGQDSSFVIPDPADAAAQFLIGATATPFVSGNFPVASGTDGLMVDSGLAAADVQDSTNIIAARTANIGGAGAGPISVVVAGLTAASIVTASIQASSNPVEVQKVTATATGFDILFSGDPGATVTVNYIAFIVAQ